MATINAIDSNIPIEITKGGTGAATLTGVLTGNGVSAITGNAVTQHGVLIGGASNAVSSLGVATNGQVFLGATGADPSFVTPTATAGGNLAVTANATTLSYGISAPVTIANGGTNAITMSTSTGIVKYDGTSLVTSSTALIDSSNRMTNTSQPAFLATCAAQTNVTGAGAGYTLQYTTEIFDQNNNFNAVSTFTAPVTGKYLFIWCVDLEQLDAAATNISTNCATTARNYRGIHGGQLNIGAVRDNNNRAQVGGTCIANMTAGDTATSAVVVSNMAGNTVDIEATTGFFSGYLIC